MSFFDWYLKCVKQHYADFAGRARRTEYWMFVLANTLVTIALFIIFNLVHLPFVASLYSLALLIPGLAVGARRLHDTGKSAWWLLIGVVPVIGTIVLIIFFATEGTGGSNEYGVDPKGLLPEQPVS